MSQKQTEMEFNLQALQQWFASGNEFFENLLNDFKDMKQEVNSLRDVNNKFDFLMSELNKKSDKINQLIDEKLTYEQNKNCDLEKIIDGLKKEIDEKKATISKNQVLIDKKSNTIESLNSAREVYEKQQFYRNILLKLEGLDTQNLCLNVSTYENFVVSCHDEKALLKIHQNCLELIKRGINDKNSNSKLLNDIMETCLECYNMQNKNKFQLQTISKGEEFEQTKHEKTSKSSAVGAIKNIIFTGIEEKNTEKIICKSYVEVE